MIRFILSKRTTVLSLLFIAGLFITAIPGQPAWFNNLGLAADCYIQGYGQGGSPAQAASEAWASVVRHAGGASTNAISTGIIDSQGRKNGERIDYSVITSQAEGTVTAVGDKLFKVMGSTQQRQGSGSYTSYLLVCMVDSPCACQLDYPSNAVAAVRSSLLPGLGHIYKGRTGRGLGFTAATVVSIAGGFIALGISNSEFTNAASARTAEGSRYYRSRGAALYWGGIAALVTGGGVHLWNIFDARNCEGVPNFR